MDRASSLFHSHFYSLLNAEIREETKIHTERLKQFDSRQLFTQGLLVLGVMGKLLNREDQLVRFSFPNKANPRTGKVEKREGRTIAKFPERMAESLYVAISLGENGPLKSKRGFFVGRVLSSHGPRTYIDVEIETSCTHGEDEEDGEFRFEQELDDDLLEELDKAGKRWRLDVWYSNLSAQRMKDSVDLMIRGVQQRTRARLKGKGSEDDAKFGVQDLVFGSLEETLPQVKKAALRFDLDLAVAPPPAESSPSSAPEVQEAPAAEGDEDEEEDSGTGWGAGRQDLLRCLEQGTGVNPSQRESILAGLSNSVTLIQGPPGTGKTWTACQLLRTIFALERRGRRVEIANRILACAFSNAAADVLLKGLVQMGIKAVRMGFPNDPSLESYAVGRRARGNPKMQGAISDLSRASAALRRAQTNGMKGSALQDYYTNVMQMRKTVKEQRLKARRKVVEEADIVVATCIGAGDPTLQGLEFQTVLVDEATQAPEPATLVPLVRGCQRLILVGDQNQLPPTVFSQEAFQGGLGISLFVRLMLRGLRPLLLTEQYRMHPYIADFISARFYGGKLKSHASVLEHRPPEGFEWPQQGPVAFVSTVDSTEALGPDGESLQNEREATLVVETLEKLLVAGSVRPELIGVLSPYRAQVEQLQKAVKSCGAPGCELVEVRTVDGFQGGEKDVVLLSTVRGNSSRKVGFLGDWRRLNVGVTRSRLGLIVFGHAPTLASDPHWAALLQYIETGRMV